MLATDASYPISHSPVYIVTFMGEKLASIRLQGQLLQPVFTLGTSWESSRRVGQVGLLGFFYFFKKPSELLSILNLGLSVGATC